MQDPSKNPPNIPTGGIPAGSRIMYPDLNGFLHPTPAGAIAENQRVEGDYSRGVSGGCGQDPNSVKNPAKDR